MSVLGLSPLGRLAGIAPLGLRLVLGVVMVIHGYGKVVTGPARFGLGLGALGVPAPELMGYVVTVVEVAGGILLLVGLLSRVAALVLAIEMVFTIALVKVDVGLISAPRGAPGAEFDLALLAGFLAIVLAGPGKFSLDRLIGLERQRTVDHPQPDLAAIGRSADGLGTVTRVPSAERAAPSSPAGVEEAPSAAVDPATAEHPPPTVVDPGPVPQSDEPAGALAPTAAGPEDADAPEPVEASESVEAVEPAEPVVAPAASPPPTPSPAPRPPVAPRPSASPVQRLRERPGLAIAAGVAAGLFIRSALRRR
ncbi:MAG TPA: DoxX family membrane protein [Solirubrobacteraceae bacterium]|nr:DoxX family membrane protein [Solirubrobacteraceae bacterium]